MVSVRPGRLLAAGFGVAPSTLVRHTEQPPLSRAISRAASIAQKAIKEARRISSSLPPASRAPALAALALAALSILSIAGEGRRGKRGKEARGAKQNERESQIFFVSFSKRNSFSSTSTSSSFLPFSKQQFYRPTSSSPSPPRQRPLPSSPGAGARAPTQQTFSPCRPPWG